MHEAFFLDDPQKISHYFVKIKNLSKTDIVSVTHVWIIDDNTEKHIINEISLPKKLDPSEIYEFSLKKDSTIDHKNIYNDIRVKLSTDKIYESKKNHKVPPFGHVAN
ncbi:hypothetical protein K8R62_01815 [bacterium]|nr:hypothetical protein [bacterium]